MKYFGGKNRLGKDLAQIINKFINDETIYIEPFVGGGGLLPHLKTPKQMILNDKHPFLMEMWKALKEGWFPTDEWSPKTSEEYLKEGQKITDDFQNNLITKQGWEWKDNIIKPKYSEAFYGYFGFQCGFSGYWNKSFSKGKTSKGEWRNYYREGLTILKLKQQAIQKCNVIFNCGDFINSVGYDKIGSFMGSGTKEYKGGKVIYLDPPYLNTTQYSTGEIDYNEFWNIVRNLSLGNWVFISEQQAPEDFIDVYSKVYTRGMADVDGKKVKAPEKLFIHNSKLKEFRKVMGE